MSKPEGAIDPRHGPFVRNAQEVAPGVWLVEQQRGTKGRGTTWRPAIIRNNPDHVPGSKAWNERCPWRCLGEVRPEIGRRQCQFNVTLWKRGRIQHLNVAVEGHFDDEAEAVRFMIATAKEFFL